MIEAVVMRWIHEQEQTLGFFFLIQGDRILWSCKSLELPWRANKVGASCAPPGVYDMALEYSPRFGKKLYELKNVPGRSEIKFHIGNFYYQLRGCIALGDHFTDLDGDGFRDLRNSRKTLARFHELMNNAPFSRLTIMSPKMNIAPLDRYGSIL